MKARTILHRCLRKKVAEYHVKSVPMDQVGYRVASRGELMGKKTGTMPSEKHAKKFILLGSLPTLSFSSIKL